MNSLAASYEITEVGIIDFKNVGEEWRRRNQLNKDLSALFLDRGRPCKELLK
jgi:hypothetical protein